MENDLKNALGLNEQQSTPKRVASSDYGTAISVSYFIAFVGWAAVVVGVFASFWLGGQGGMALAALPGAITIILVGLMLVLGAQATRAVMDNANYSRQMLEKMSKE